MRVKKVNLRELKPYINSAFDGDDELMIYYDRSAKVKSIHEACENVYDKIKSVYPDATMYGVEIAEDKEGYFVYRDNLLISFGINLKYRNKETLPFFWREIQNKLGNNFHSALYSHNIRAIQFLEKCGMKILFDHITILSYN